MSQKIKIECSDRTLTFTTEKCCLIMKPPEDALTVSVFNMSLPEALINGIYSLEKGDELDTFLHEIPRVLSKLRRKQAGLI